MITFQDLARKMHMKDDLTEFLMDIVRETVEMREKDNIRRNEFMDPLIEIKNNGA